MSPQRKRKAAQLEATTAEPTTEAVQAPSGLRRSARKIPVKQTPVATRPVLKRRAIRAEVPQAGAGTTIEHIGLDEATSRETQLTIVPPKEKAKSRAKGKGKAKATVEMSEGDEQDDYRAARWRPHPPQAVMERIFRCRTQRMFVIGRVPVEGADPPQEQFQIAGTTGNIYTVHIKNRPTCTCPDGRKSGTCKHILYVMIKALRAREDLVYQIALTNKELREIFTNAPAPGTTVPPKSTQKPLDEDDCPICYSEFDSNQSIVFCRAMCGTNIHNDCFRQWEAMKGSDGVTCVMCRTKWEYEESIPGIDLAVDVGSAKPGSEGFLNVGTQLGLNQRRNYDPNAWMGYRYFHK
ncbi:hypothetical protein EV426DRAFT_585844 [Tirmania nivea]|nr:hypothetical protein EV426DRAFT_585844 [Tirmania nivea]